MRNRSEELKIHKVDSYKNLPKVSEGQVLIAPITDLLYDEPVMPVNNTRSWPDWWKEIESKDGSLRRCAGVADYISQGFTITMWSDLDFRPSVDHNYWESRFDVSHDHPFQVQSFDYGQTGSCPVTKVRKLEKANYIKMINPWLFKTAPGWSCLFLPVSWEPNPNFTLLPSMVNTDYYHHANIVMNILTDEPFKIRQGTPLQHVIPIPRTKALEILWASQDAYHHMDQKGFGSAFMPINMKGKYKKAQRAADSQKPEKKSQNIFCRFFRFILRK